MLISMTFTIYHTHQVATNVSAPGTDLNKHTEHRSLACELIFVNCRTQIDNSL
jgi:hypothetical protein